jgi:thiol-disulfide isomerase/thioredoxin
MIDSIAVVLMALLGADPVPAVSPAEQLAQLAKEGGLIEDHFHAELKKAGRDKAQVTAANDKYRADCSAWADQANALLKAHPAEPATLDVILVLSDIHFVDDETVEILRRHHFANPKVFGMFNSFSQSSPGPRRQFVEDMADKHPDRTVRGKTTFALAQMDRVYLIDGLKEKPVFGGRLGTPDQLRTRARLYLQRVVNDYAEIESDEEGTLGELARFELEGLDNIGRLEVGKVAPDIVGVDFDGKPLKFTARSGKATLLVFWGTWCGPCMRLVPREAALAQKYNGRPFQLYGVNGGDERDVAKDAALSKQMTWPSFYSSHLRSGIAAVWNVVSWPAVYVIGPDGVITYKGHGDGMEEAIEAAVLKAEMQAPATDRPN